MSSLPASSPSLLTQDPRLISLRRQRFSFSKLLRALTVLCYIPEDTIAVGEALCDLAAMRIPGSLILKYGLIARATVFIGCEENGELARVTRERLIVRRDLYYAESGRYPLMDVPLCEMQNRENMRLERLDARSRRR